jgi:hypothetical protein
MREAAAAAVAVASAGGKQIVKYKTAGRDLA